MYIHKAHRFSCVKLILESNIGVQQQEQIVKERGFWDHQYKKFETTQECPKKSSSTLTLNTINVIFLQFSRPCHKHQPKEFLIFPHATLSLLQSSQFKHCTTFLVKKLPYEYLFNSFSSSPSQLFYQMSFDASSTCCAQSHGGKLQYSLPPFPARGAFDVIQVCSLVSSPERGLAQLDVSWSLSIHISSADILASPLTQLLHLGLRPSPVLSHFHSMSRKDMQKVLDYLHCIYKDQN